MGILGWRDGGLSCLLSKINSVALALFPVWEGGGGGGISGHGIQKEHSLLTRSITAHVCCHKYIFKLCIICRVGVMIAS